MATTPNFGWVMPDPTDFVTNLPADFEVFGDDVDADVWAIKGTADAAISKTIVNAAGDLIYGTANDTVTRLGIGTAGQVLKVNSGATAPEWGTISGGGMTLLATATPSAATTLSFTSIPTTHKHLKLIWEDVTQSTSGYWFIRFNSDTASNYTQAGFSNASSTSSTMQAFWTTGGAVGGTQAWQHFIASTDISAGELNIWRYAQLEQRRFNGQGGNYINAGGFTLIDGSYTSTASAITSIEIIRSSTQTITGTFYLYGVD